MKLFQKLILLVGACTLGVLLWKMDAALVLVLVAQVGWGFLLIIGQETGAHLLNTAGWSFALRPEHGPSYPFRELFKFRIVGDGINYLTPSATIAGELARAAQLNESQPFEVRLAGVVAAKFTQALAQFCFVLFGTAWVVRGMIGWLAPYEPALLALAWMAAAALPGIMLWDRLRARSPGRPARQDPAPGWKGVPTQFRHYLHDHPGRAAVSVLFFLLGYAWNTLEVWLIARMLGAPVGWRAALAIEVLSNMIDGIFFMVPAKMGTQEAGKTAIFAALGLPARAGLALGIVRHIRELVWSSLGLLLYTLHLRGSRTEGPELASR